jgi:hypothetical protein
MNTTDEWFDATGLLEDDSPLPRFPLPGEPEPFPLVKLAESAVPDTTLDPLPCFAVGLP